MAKENREHKSSVFADLFYYDETAKENLLELHNALYGTEYSDPGVVFYNGVRNQPLEQTLRLPDAFMEKEEEPGLELVVRVININSDKHHELLEKCRVLKEYSLFVETVRKYQKEKAPLKKAIKECIEKDILADYLLRKSSEVINMLMAEYDYETDIEVQREEAAEIAAEIAAKEARQSGLAEGQKMLKQAILLRRAGKTHEEIAVQYSIPVEEVKDMLEGLE